MSARKTRSAKRRRRLGDVGETLPCGRLLLLRHLAIIRERHARRHPCIAVSAGSSHSRCGSRARPHRAVSSPEGPTERIRGRAVRHPARCALRRASAADCGARRAPSGPRPIIEPAVERLPSFPAALLFSRCDAMRIASSPPCCPAGAPLSAGPFFARFLPNCYLRGCKFTKQPRGAHTVFNGVRYTVSQQARGSPPPLASAYPLKQSDAQGIASSPP